MVRLLCYAQKTIKNIFTSLLLHLHCCKCSVIWLGMQLHRMQGKIENFLFFLITTHSLFPPFHFLVPKFVGGGEKKVGGGGGEFLSISGAEEE